MAAVKPEKLVTLQSSDGEEFVVGHALATRFTTLAHLFLDLGDDDNSDAPIPTPNIPADILKLVLEFATHHKDDNLPKDDDEWADQRRKSMTEWDLQFFQRMRMNTVINVMLAANYLDHRLLLETCAKHIANESRDKTIEQLEVVFNTKVTAEDIAEVKRKYPWADPDAQPST